MGAGASAAVHNPVTRVAAGVVTGGMSEVYYTPRDVAIAARDTARGRPGRAMVRLITSPLIAGELADGAAEAVRPARRP